jgi:ATP-dependent RNA helicase DHX8/PRP22
VHITALRAGVRVNHPSEVVARGQAVKVKVISMSGGKLSLSIKDVDQATGADLMPSRQAPAFELAAAGGAAAAAAAAAAVPAAGRSWGSSLTGISGVKVADDDAAGGRGKRQKRATSQERFEHKQLIASGVLDVSEYPGFDDDGDGAAGAGAGGGRGVLRDTEDLDEAEFEIEVREDEPAFLRGQLRLAREIEPVRLVANPDGSMQRAAVAQSGMAKERRELKEQQKLTLLDAIPKDLERAWADPLATSGERHLAQEVRSIGMGLSSVQAVPEWKATQQASAVSYGQRSTLSIKEQRERLPIFGKRAELLSLIAENQVVVVIGDTGSGKTTQLTQYLHEAGYTRRGIVGCTQPRRVAAMSVSKRVAEEAGVRLGEEVGYSIRFEDCTSPSTVIKFMTDGMLMREYLMDNSLTRYSVLVLDEAHERTIATDILFGLLKKLLKKRADLKLIVTSATLVKEKFQRYFYDCPSYTIPGRTFKVETHYLKEPESDYLEAAVVTVMQIHLREPPGDILLFLTGQEEIDNACETLYARMQALQTRGNMPELLILPVYSAQSSEMQSKIFDPAPPGKRKCIVATNIAEASLTIDGIHYVVDPGFSKQKVFNPKTGMDSLVVVPISQASAMQRTGRAGRTGPGVCYRLYTSDAFQHEMLPTTAPEIQRANLSNVVLQMKAMGINDLMHFDFMDPPANETLVQALEQLYKLGALDEEGLLTRLGRKMAEFPLEPQLSKVLLASVDLGCSEEVLTIVAMLSVENCFYRPKDRATQADQKKSKFAQPEGDHITFLTVYNAWAAAKFSNAWCFENFIQSRSMRKAQEVRKQLVGIMDRYKLDLVSCGRNYRRVQKAIGSGFFMNVAKKDAQEGYKTMSDGQPVYIHPSSTLFQKNPDMVLYHELVLTTKEYMRGVMAIDAKWLVEVAPRYFKAADASKLSKAKKRIKVEPLFNKFELPDSWRLSYRRG